MSDRMYVIGGKSDVTRTLPNLRERPNPVIRRRPARSPRQRWRGVLQAHRGRAFGWYAGWATYLEIGLIGYRHVVIEENLVVLRANELGQRPLTALIALVGLPGPIERVWILHRDIHFQRVAAVDQVPALRHMKFLGVRRAEGIDDSF